MKKIYLDYAASTPMDSAAVRAMQPFFSEQFYNPSAAYLAAQHGTKRALESARQSVAGVLGARPAEVIFTGGATEANNLAIQGVLKAFPGGEVITSTVEHPSVIEPANLYAHRLAPVDKTGTVDVPALARLINDKTVLVSVMLVNHELGTIQPVSQIARLIAEVRRHRLQNSNKLPIYLHSDVAQAANYLDLSVARLGVDLMSINGSKIYGPKQSGALYVRAGIKLSPLILGGGQEFGLRAGTENLPAIAGFVAALENAHNVRLEAARKISQLRKTFEAEVTTALPLATVNGVSANRAPHITSLTFAGTDNERLMMQLDEAGVQAAVGSACSAGSGEPSHVLAAIGLNKDLARSTLRFSLGKHTKAAELKTTAGLLKKLAR